MTDDYPIAETIGREILELWDTTMLGKGRGLTKEEDAALWRVYQQRRIAIIRKYGYTEKAFQRALNKSYHPAHLN